ncbi:MAG: HAMP domain-containing histidine kinase [Burkholderiales bacterium]|nr:HAMP domain-containing histidine kinase [Burkholderiales bacterium]
MRLLPRSLLGRVFALYALTLVAFIAIGLALFVQHQFTRQLADAGADARTVGELLRPVLADSAVIGDYDTIDRVLRQAARHSSIAELVFTDPKGGVLRVQGHAAGQGAPAWLLAMVADRLAPTALRIEAGGLLYGQLQLRVSVAAIAGALWHQAAFALLLALAAVAGGLLLIRPPLVRWLGHLDRIEQLGLDLEGGAQRVRMALADDAPTEIRRTYEALDRAATHVQAERDAALAALRRALEGASVLDVSGAAAGKDDIEVVSMLVSRLVARLQERTAQLDAIFTLSPDGFVSFDADHVVRYASPGFTRLTGLSADMVLGLEEDVLMFRLRSRCTGPRLARLGELREAQRTPDGEAPRHLIELARPRRRVLELALHAGDTIAISQVLHLRDVTHESEVEQMKSEFVTTAAHELRTPMVGIYGFAELLLTRDMPAPRQQDLLGRIYRQSEVMISILNEMLDLARLQARGGADLALLPMALDTLLRDTLDSFQPPDGRAPPRWEAGPGPRPVQVDAAKLQRALRNLLSNAYKYSPAGGEVLVRLHERQGPQGGLEFGIEVQDHGIGLTAEQLARVGERFYRADKSGSVLGTGLGVALVREIVTLHGGSMALRSAPGEGTSVTLWLPASPAPAARLPAPESTTA